MPSIFPFLTKLRTSEQMYLITFHVNLSRGNRAGIYERTDVQLDRRTDMTKLIDVFRDLAKASKNIHRFNSHLTPYFI